MLCRIILVFPLLATLSTITACADDDAPAPISAPSTPPLGEVRRAYLAGHYDRALAAADAALQAQPDDPRLHLAAGLSACRLGLAPRAATALPHLTPAEQARVRRVCADANQTLPTP